MAKKIKFDTDKTNIGNDLDFPDYNFDLPSTKDDRKPATKIVTGLAAGVKSTVTDPNYIKTTIRNSLPTGYGDALDLTDQLAGSVKKVYSDAVKDIRPVVKELKSTTKRIIPLADKILPRKISEKIKRWSDSDVDYKTISAEEQRNASLQAQLGEIFKYQSEAAMQQNAESSAKENIQASIEHARHKDNFSQLDAQRISLQQLVNYQNKVTAGFQRQSLELQFRHYYVAVDTLIETKRQNAVTTAALESITKNTGLPEFAKLQKTEYLQQSIRNKFIDGAYDAIREKRREFIKKVTDNVGQSVKDKLGEILQAVSTGVSLANTAVDASEQAGDSGVDKIVTGSEIAGGLATNYLTDKVTKRARKITEANPTIAKGGRKAGILAKNFPQIVNEVAQDDEYTEQEGALRKGIGFLLNAFGGIGRDAVRGANRVDTGLQVDSAGSLLETSKAGFTNRSDRSLNEVIPGLLSRIHRELKIIRTGDEKAELVEYDFTKSTFSEKSTIVKGIKNSLLNRGVKEEVNTEVDAVLKKLDPQGKLSVEATDALKKLFLSDNLTGVGKSGTFDRLTKEGTYRGDTSKYSNQIIDLVRTNLIGEGDSSARELEFTRLFSNIGTSIADPRSSIQTLVNLGYSDYLKEIGVISTDGKSVDLKAYYEYYLDTTEAKPDEVVAPTAKRRRKRQPLLKPAPVQSFTNAKTILPTFDQNTTGTTAGASGVSNQESTMMLMASIDKINPKPELMMIVDILGAINNRLSTGIITYGSADVESADSTGKAWWDKSLKDTAIAGKDAGVKGFDALRGFIKTTAGKIGSGLSQISAPLIELAKKGFTTITDRLRSIRDVYVKGELGPRVLAYKIKLGHYIDIKTGVVITKYTDITGAIRDITLPEGSAPVISDEEIGNAEIRDNFVVKTIKSLGAKVKDGVTAVKTLIDSLPSRVQTGIQLAKKGFDLIFSQPQDVYVKGKKLPALIGATMKNGGYLSALTGKSIAHPGEIDGAVVDALNGQTVLTQEEFYGGLYNAKGEIIKTGVAKLADEARKIYDFAGNQVRKGLKAIGSGLSRGIKAVGEFIGKASPTINIGNSYESGEYQSIGIITRLTQIRDILNKRLEGQPDEFEKDDFAMPEDPKKPRLKSAGFITRLGRGLRKATAAGINLIGKSVASSTKLAVGGIGLAAKGVAGAGKFAFNSAGTLGRLGLGAAKLTGRTALGLTKGANQAAGYVYDAATGLYRFVGDGLSAAGGAIKRAGNNFKDRSQAGGNVDPANPTSPGAPGLKGKGLLGLAGNALGSGLSGLASLFGPVGSVLFGAGGLLVSGLGKAGKGLLNAGKGLKDKLFGDNKQLKVLTEIRDLLSSRLAKPATASAGLDKATIAEKTKSLFGDETPENKDDNGPNGSATGENGADGSLLDDAADIAEIGDAVGNRGGKRGGKRVKGKVLKGGGNLLSKVGKVGSLGLKGLGVAGAAYGTYSAYDNITKGNYGEAALDAGGAALSGGLAFGGLSAVGTGLGAAAAAIGGVLASPVFLAGLAVAAVGVGAYYGYKYLNKNKLDTLSTYRYAQYGFLASDDAHLQPIFSLEEDLLPGVVYANGVAKFDPSKVKLNDVAKKFGVDESNGKQLNQLVAWFNGRFKPVYLTHLTALKKTKPDLSLADIDSKLKPMEKKAYLTLVEFAEGPYDLRISPFPDQPDGLIVGNSEVKDAYAVAKAKIEQDASKETTKDGEGKSASVAAGAALGLAAAGPLGALAGAAVAATTGSKTTSGIDTQKLSNDLSKSAVLSGVDAGVGAIAAAGMVAPMANFGNGIDPLTAVRFKAYGLTELRMDRARVFKVLEEAIMIDVTFNSKKQATWAGSIDRVIARYGVSFNIDSQSGKATNDFIRWFNFRFLPVFLNYATNLAAFSGKQNLGTALDSLSTQGMYDLAVVIINTMSSQDGGSTPVWNIAHSPWNDYTLNQDRASTNGEIALLKSKVKVEVIPTKGLASEGGGAAAVAAAGINATESVNKPGLLSRVYNSTVEAVSRGVGGAYDYLVDKTSQGIESGINAGKSAGAAASNAYAGAVDKTSRGIESVATTIAGLTKGDGGTYDSIPFPTASGTWAGLRDTITAAARAVGVDPSLLARIAAAESGFKYDIKNPGGSATGLFQFISTTWDGVMKKYGAQFGIPLGTRPTDPRANALLGAQFIKDNIQSIQKYLDRGVSPTDVYMAHFLGDAGAKKFLTTNPNELVTNVFPKIVAQNASVVFDAKNGGAPRTLGQVYDYFTGRLNSVAKGFKLGGEAPSTGTKTVDPAVAAKTVIVNEGNAGVGGNAADADANSAASKAALKATSPSAGINAFGTAATPLLSGNLAAANAVTPTANSGSAAPAAPTGINAASQAGALAGGITPSALRPTNDLVSQAKLQREAAANDMMGPISDTLTKSMNIQQAQLEALNAILKVVMDKSGFSLGGDVTKLKADALGTNGPEYKSTTPAPTAPVSMRKAAY